MSPQWKPVLGFEGCYEVSDDGQVKSLARIVTNRLGHRRAYPEKILSPGKGPDGHLVVSLWKGGKQTMRQVHRLVLDAFVGENPGLWGGLHWDDDPANNRIENLRWGTAKNNSEDMLRNSGHFRWSQTECKHGHEYTPESSYVNAKGSRECRICHRASEARRRERARQS